MFITFCAVAGEAQARDWELGAQYQGQILSNLAGGIATGTRYLDKLSLGAAYRFRGAPGLRAVASVQYVNGVAFSADLVGDTQIVSNLEADRGVRPYDAALEWAASDGSAMLRFGMTDLNAYFDVQDPGLLFINSSDGLGKEFSQTGQNGPSIFPTTALALVGGTEFGGGWAVQAGLFNAIAGDPDNPDAFVALKTGGGALLVAELDYASPDQRWKVELGGWGYTASFAALSETRPDGTPARVGGNAGAYAIIEHRFFEAGERALDGWLRLGFASDRINAVGSYAGGGLVLSAPLGGRDDDAAGIAVTRAMFGGPARAATPGLERAETTIELTYAAQITDWLMLQPDFQYVINPSGDPALRNAVVLGLAFTLAIDNARGDRE